MLSKPIEELIKLVLQNGSALTVLNMMQGMIEARSEGFEAYARVLLSWYTNRRYLINLADGSEAFVEPMLLQALRDVSDPQLRRDIQEVLMIKPSKRTLKKDEGKKSTAKEKLAAKKKPVASPARTVSEKGDGKRKLELKT
jgi:hypothetical protein